MSVQQAKSGSIPGVIEKFKLCFLHPNQLFDRVKDEQGYEGPIKFYLLIAFINLIIANIILITLVTLMPPVAELLGFIGPIEIIGGLFSNIINTNLTIIFSVLGTFLSAGFVHLFALIFGAKGGYHSTYKAIVYCTGPSIFILPVSLIPFVGLFISLSISIWTLYLFLKGLSVFHNISMARAFGIATVMVITTIAIIFLVVFSLAFSLLGILSPTVYSTSTAVGFPGFQVPESGCQLKSSGEFTLTLRNMMGSEIEITKVEATYNDKTMTDTTKRFMKPADQETITLSGLGTSTPGSPYSVSVEITYTNQDTGLTLKSAGTVSGTVTI